jgi:hypothetical protein
MGVNDAQQNRKDDKRRAANERKAIFTRTNAKNGVADWESVEGAIVVKAAAAIAGHGGALRLGYTRDGGAYAIGLYDGDDKSTVYVPPSESVEEALNEIIEYYRK